MQQRSPRSIMAAVESPERPSRSLLRKAATLARARGCAVDLVHVISLPYGPAVNMRATVQQAAREIVADRERRLQKLASGRELRGVKARAFVSWDYPAADGIVRHVLKRHPALLMAESHRHARLARPFLSNTDWELIRKCPCPVWLSKSARIRPDAAIVAALDPLHAHAKPAALDAIILRQAMAAAGGRAARVLPVHAYSLPQTAVAETPVEAYWIGMSERDIERYESKLRGELERLVRHQRIPLRNLRVVAGDPAFALPRIARKERAALVVMGAVSRGALARVFIGHTAERVIDALQADVLIVKPHGFKTPVLPRQRPLMIVPPL